MKKGNLFTTKYFIVILMLILFPLFSLHTESKHYIDEDKGYNIIGEITLAGKEIPEDDMEEYRTQVFDWCNDIGHNARILYKLPKEAEWGLQQTLSEYNLEEGETYIVRLTKPTTKSTNSIMIILLTITDSNRTEEPEFEIMDIIESYIELDPEVQETTDSTGQTIYSHSLTGYKGHATARLIGSNLAQEELRTLIENIHSFSNSEGYRSTEIHKLTKEQEWLMGQALGKYRLQTGETYTLSIAPEPKSFPAIFTAIVMVVIITDVDNTTGSYSYNFKAYESIAITD